ncbi:F-box only protein 21-like [Babylonia areolata]|uniref:F-box only protein 21-like n=1 Tax=Babylonia areolata TaxID=304850 RepID=UPI003FD29996
MASDGKMPLLSLPPELWLEVMKSDVLDAKDICNLSQVCRLLNEISHTHSNDVWKAKVRQRWPEQSYTASEEGWRELYKIRRRVQVAVEVCLADLEKELYQHKYVSTEHFAKFIEITELHEEGIVFVIDDLFAILDSPRNTRLTDKFYAAKVVKFVQQHHLRSRWAALIAASEEKQDLETGAQLVSCWMQATKKMSTSEVTAELDGIADRVRDMLHSKCQGAKVHPACDKDNSIIGFTESLWSTDQSREVLEAVNKVLYEEMGLEGNNSDYFAMENSFIKEVLQRKKGIPITLSVIYQAVARRLGVVCEPINFPNHFLLAFRTGSGEDTVYIDAFHKGRMMTSQECMSTLLPDHDYTSTFFDVAKPLAVFERMARNLVCLMSTDSSADETIPVFHDAVRLFLAITPDDLQMILVYTNLCLHLNIDLQEAINMLSGTNTQAIGGLSLISHCKTQIILNEKEDQQRKTTVKIRSRHPEVTFSVGLVMKHKRYNYMCVIYGWDIECKASEEWIRQMGVDHLPRRQYQPFYNVLVEDGTIRYAAQENLLFPEEVKEIPHEDIGRYFQEFTGQYYKPNSCKHAEYPDDDAWTNDLLIRKANFDH